MNTNTDTKMATAATTPTTIPAIAPPDKPEPEPLAFLAFVPLLVLSDPLLPDDPEALAVKVTYTSE